MEGIMNIIIVGCGKVGSALTEQLANENHNVTVIDVDGEIVQDVSSGSDVRGVAGNGASYLIQQEAGIQTADLSRKALALPWSSIRNMPQRLKCRAY